MVDATGQWVDVVFIQDWDEELSEAGEYGQDPIEFGDWDKMAEYMAKWDYGTETDDAHTSGSCWGQQDTLVEVNVGGLDYVLSANWGLRYASLNRRPLKLGE